MAAIRFSPDAELLFVTRIAGKAVFLLAQDGKVVGQAYSFNQICMKSHIRGATAMVLLGAKLEFPDEKTPASEESFLGTWAGRTTKGDFASKTVPLTNES